MCRIARQNDQYGKYAEYAPCEADMAMHNLFAGEIFVLMNASGKGHQFILLRESSISISPGQSDEMLHSSARKCSLKRFSGRRVVTTDRLTGQLGTESEARRFSENPKSTCLHVQALELRQQFKIGHIFFLSTHKTSYQLGMPMPNHAVGFIPAPQLLILACWHPRSGHRTLSLETHYQ